MATALNNTPTNRQFQRRKADKWVYCSSIIFVDYSQHFFALRPLIFHVQQEVLKFNDICVSLSLPKIYQCTKY